MFVFFAFAALLIFLGYKSLRGGVNYFNYFKIESSKTPSEYTPFCSVIAPCRGLERNLQSNLAALFEQNYPRYELIFVVDDAADSAVPTIRELINRQNNLLEKSSGGNVYSRLVVAKKAVDCGQKVENLREAVRRVSDESEVFVFTDSDARPNKDWLRSLIAPLRDAEIGAATGYRWFISKNNNFVSQLCSVWNASIASALGANRKSNFCWGGATAMRRAVFEKIKMRERWRGTLSDDFTVTRALKEANLPIYFVPNALTVSIQDYNFKEMLEFTTRQMKITRVYAPHLWAASFIGSVLFAAVFWTGVALLFTVSGGQFWMTVIILLTIFALGAGKAWLRLKAVKMVLKNYEKELNKSIIWQVTLWTVTPFIYFYNCAAAFFSNEICWRGIRYKLESPDKTVLIK